ncbi:MAG: CoA pyrophosphatase [Nitrososphaerota archaeon]|nr:CoA pyrophosphatase [Candidatus Calditenuaceae archaeon]MDW8073258.1 CoA pyrophosphatase [Nitrososphaerota archaeon]
MDWLARLSLTRSDEPPRGGRGECAVAVILTVEGELLLVRRAERAGDPWSGQWALPGGFWKERDGSLLETAFREVWEEVGIEAGGLKHVGWLKARSPRTRPDIVVYPFVFLAEGRLVVRLSDELENFRWVPLRGLERGVRLVETAQGPLEVEAYLWEGVAVWGLTYSVLKELRGE